MKTWTNCPPPTVITQPIEAVVGVFNIRIHSLPRAVFYFSMHTDLSILPIDHPGAHDHEYRKRRNIIAQAAIDFRKSHKNIPIIEYTDTEHATWQTAVTQLAPLHEKHACSLYLQARARLSIDQQQIPQLNTLSQNLTKLHGFRLEPIEGLVDSRSFLSRLADRVMLCTQYIRHNSRPDYTPEPDIIHEVIGHVPTFTDSDIVAFSEFLGRVALKANQTVLEQLERLYWFTLEFGLIQEKEDIKVFGAGILSSFGEMKHVFSKEVIHRPFRLEDVIRTPFDFSSLQTQVFIVPSFQALRKQTEAHFNGN